ncbi:MAG: hypothetical protein AAF414_14030 [Pseudomonadota bacterium]
MKATIALFLAALLLAACESEPAAPVATAPVGADVLFPPQLEAYYDVDLPTSACVSDTVMRADMLSQLRNQIMITGLSCRGAYPGLDEFNEYVNFTVRHQNRLRDVQSTLGSFLSQQRGGRAARQYDTYATEIANSESQTVLALSPDNYCLARYYQFQAVTRMTDADIQNYLDLAVQRRSSAYRTCG